MGTATGILLGEYWKKHEVQAEFDMLFEEAQRREEQIGKKAWKNAMVMFKVYLETGKSNFHKG